MTSEPGAAYTEEDLLPLSALQHLVFCERQCALIHVEGQWVDNVLTLEGRQLHERADSGEAESRGDARVTRSLPLRSFRLGLAGRADAVEFHRPPAGEAGGGDGATRWRPYPIEYKRGRPKPGPADEVQLCAQALCLEEMLGVPVPAGALYYGRPRRRQEVVFTAELRQTTEEAAARLRRLFTSGRTPPAVLEPKCRRCSLIEICLPAAAGLSARGYLERAREEALEEP